MAAEPGTIERLRRLLRDDFEGFLEEIEDVIARSEDAASREFWISMKKLAEQHRRGYPGNPR